MVIARGLMGVMLMVLVGACASPQRPTSAVAVPEKLNPGAGESLAMIVAARGVQIYECRPRKDQAGVYEWAFVAPEADLFDGCSPPMSSCDSLTCPQTHLLM